ncbi:MAG: hypothetical protein H7A34_00280 [bacterium]|nr:hypothetical protein [bacterium]
MLKFTEFLSRVTSKKIKDIYFHIPLYDPLAAEDEPECFVIELEDGQVITFKYLIYEGDESLELDGERVIPYRAVETDEQHCKTDEGGE